MSKRDTKLYLEDIREATAHIESYTHGLSFEEFKNDPKTIDAVVRNFEIMGEAAAHLTDEFKETHPEIPWSRVAGMRNKIAHEYFGIDSEIIWKTIQEDIPRLKALMAKLN